MAVSLEDRERNRVLDQERLRLAAKKQQPETSARTRGEVGAVAARRGLITAARIRELRRIGQQDTPVDRMRDPER